MIPDGLPLSCGRACAGRLEHGGLAREPGARHASCATRWQRWRGSRDVEVELFEFLPGPLSYPLAALALRRRFDAVEARHRPRPLRPDRLAGARAARPAARGHAARHRCAPPAHAASDARRAGAHGSRGDRVGVARAGARTGASRRRRCCRAASRSTVSARSRATRRDSRSDSTGEAPCLLFPFDPERAGQALRPRARARGRRAPDDARRDGARPRDARDQRRQRGAGPVRGGGLRPRGARGARLRRAGARDAGRRASRRRWRGSRARSARPMTASAGRRRSSRSLAQAGPARRRARARRGVLLGTDGGARRGGLALAARQRPLGPLVGRPGMFGLKRSLWRDPGVDWQGRRERASL